MSLMSYKHDADSVILRIKILDSSVTTGAGLTGLTFSSTGLTISTIADNEASPTTYTASGSTIEDITTLGTYEAPTATKCRFKEVSASHAGVYEVQLADERYAVASAKSLLVSISGATNAAETDAVIPLTQMDPYDAVRGGMTSLPNAAADAAGGLPISDAGALDLDTYLDNIYATVVSGISTAVEAAAGKHSLAAVAMIQTNSAVSGTTLTAKNPSDDSTFQTYTLTTSATADPITSIA